MIIFIFITAIYSYETHQLASKNLILQNTNYQTVELGNDGDFYYFVNISIGTPAQYLNVQVDTGSNVLWVTNSSCSGCNIITRFNSAKSTTYQNLDKYDLLEYGSGICSGWLSEDIVALVDTPIDTKFEFLLVTKEDDFNFQEGTSGIMGLSNDQSNVNIFQNAYQAQQINSSLFGFLFSHSGDSYLLYDLWNQTVLDDAIWINTNSDTRWSLQLLDMTINGVSQKINETSAIFDSGTTCLVLQPTIYNTMMQYFNDEVCLTSKLCSCDSPTYPNLTFYFQGAKVTVTPDKYMVPTTKSYCMPCFQETPQFFILGDPFMQSFVSIFNKEQSSIGLYGAQPLNVLPSTSIIIMLALQSIMLIGVIVLICKNRNS